MARTANPRRKPNPRGEGGQLRDEITEAALRLVENEPDPSGITLRGVAREAGITAPSIYAHFDNLEAVMTAVVDRVFAQLATSLENTLTAHDGDEPVSRLRALCHTYVSFAAANPHLYRLAFDKEDHSPFPPEGSARPVPKSVETIPGAAAFGLLVRAIDACVVAGRSASTDTQRDATLLWAALHGYAGLRRSSSDFPWPPHAETVDHYADRLACLTP